MTIKNKIWWRINYTDALIDREKQLLLDWSAKAGCSVWTKTFFRSKGILEEAITYHPWVHLFRSNVYYARYGVATFRDLCNSEMTRIKLVREPFSRAVSSYIHMMKFPDHMVRRFAGSENPDLSFREFLGFISGVNLTHANPHYRTQQRPYEVEGAVIDHIIHLERITEELEALYEATGVKLDPYGVTSHHHVKKVGTIRLGAADLAWSEVKNSVPPYESFYNETTEKIVLDLYRQDFSAYGYCPDSKAPGLIADGAGRQLEQEFMPTALTHLKYRLCDLVRHRVNRSLSRS